MNKCLICSYTTNGKEMLLNHFRDIHGFSKVEGKGRGTILRRCIFEAKVPRNNGKLYVNKAELPLSLRLILDKKNSHINMQRCKLKNMLNIPKIVGGGDLSNTNQGIVGKEAKQEKRLQDGGEKLQKNQEESFYECSDCDYASINEHELFDHVESTHVKVETEGQSKSSPGTKEKSDVEKDGDNLSAFKCDTEANADSGFKEVVLQYNVGREEPVEVPEPQFMPYSNEDSDDDLDEFIEGPEESSTPASNLRAHIKDDHGNTIQTHSGGQGCSNILNPTTTYKSDLCDYKTQLKSDLKGHASVVHENSQGMSKFKCLLCDYSSSRGNDMRQHYSKLHPPPADKPISRWVDGLGKNTKKSAARDDSNPQPRSRQQRDLNNSMERLRRLDQKIHFDLLKDKVPKLRDAETASKAVILKEAAEYARLLGGANRALAQEREREAERNAELRRRLESAKLKYLDDDDDDDDDDMEFIETEAEKAENYGNAGGSEDSGFSSVTGEGGPDLMGLSDYLPIVESALTMF